MNQNSKWTKYRGNFTLCYIKNIATFHSNKFFQIVQCVLVKHVFDASCNWVKTDLLQCFLAWAENQWLIIAEKSLNQSQCSLQCKYFRVPVLYRRWFSPTGFCAAASRYAKLVLAPYFGVKAETLLPAIVKARAFW